jgi:hypothetical protein
VGAPLAITSSARRSVPERPSAGDGSSSSNRCSAGARNGISVGCQCSENRPAAVHYRRFSARSSRLALAASDYHRGRPTELSPFKNSRTVSRLSPWTASRSTRPVSWNPSFSRTRRDATFQSRTVAHNRP